MQENPEDLFESEPLAGVKEEPDLFDRSVRGGFWVFALRFCVWALFFVQTIILANTLGVTKWGLLAIAGLSMRILGIFTTTGFDAALIQKKKDIKVFLDVAWTAGIIRGILLFSVLWFMAPYAADFFDRPGKFRDKDINNPGGLIIQLREGTDEMDGYLRENLPEQTQKLLGDYVSGDVLTREQIDILVEGINEVIVREDFYEQGLHEGMELSVYAEKLIKKYAQVKDTIRLNSRLLQESYPDKIREVVIDVPTTLLLIRLLGISFILGSLGNIGTIYFKKDLDFHKQFGLQMIGQFAESIVTIFIAVVYRSVWCLVWGKLTGILINCIASYFVHPYRPRLNLDFDKVKELWIYGRWIFVGTIFGFIMTEGDDIFVGKYLGSAALALYLMAYKFAQIPTSGFSVVINQVSFPAFSKVQDDLPRLKDAYLKVLKVTCFITIPLAGMIFILTPEFVTIFLKEEWLPVIPVMQILVIQGMTRSISSTRDPVWQSLGKPGITVWVKVLRLILLIVLIYPLTAMWGIVGTGCTILFIAIIIQPIGYYLLIRELKCGLWDLLCPICFGLGGTVVMLIVISVVRKMLFADISFVSFVVLGVFGVISYFGAAFILDKLLKYGMKEIIIEQIDTVLRLFKFSGKRTGIE